MASIKNIMNKVTNGLKGAGELALGTVMLAADLLAGSNTTVSEKDEYVHDPINKNENGIVLFPNVNELNKTASHNYSGSSSVYQKCYKSNDSKDDLISKFLQKWSEIFSKQLDIKEIKSTEYDSDWLLNKCPIKPNWFYDIRLPYQKEDNCYDYYFNCNDFQILLRTYDFMIGGRTHGPFYSITYMKDGKKLIFEYTSNLTDFYKKPEECYETSSHGLYQRACISVNEEKPNVILYTSRKSLFSFLKLPIIKAASTQNISEHCEKFVNTLLAAGEQYDKNKEIKKIEQAQKQKMEQEKKEANEIQDALDSL